MNTQCSFTSTALILPLLTTMACSGSGSESTQNVSDLKVCATEKRVAGIDISHHNGLNKKVDWPSIRRADKWFVFIKAYEDGVGFDERFSDNWTNSFANGFIRGAYYFFNTSSYNDNNALEFSKAIGKLGPGDLPAVLDVDEPKYLVAAGRTKDDTIKSMQAWLSIVERETGKRPIIYASINSWNALGNTKQFSGYSLWLANYQSSPNVCPSLIGGWANWLFWQYSATGSVPGANTTGLIIATDLDLYNGTYAELQSLAGCTKDDSLRIPACASITPCQSKPDGQYCGGTISGYAGNATDIVSCSGGTVADFKLCSSGCIVRDILIGDICAATSQNPNPGPSCNDKIKNGNETSLDCGGGTCPPCADNLACAINTDCANGYCASNVCISAPQVIVDNRADPYNLTLDASNIYWVEKRVGGGALCKVPKSGGTTTTLSSNLAEPTAVTVDSGFAYVLERNNGSNGMIHRVPLAGGSSELVVSGLTNAQNNLVQAGNNLYWGDYVPGVGGVIKTASKGANSTASIVAQGNGLLNLQTAIDTDGIYLFIRNDLNQMLRFPIAGGSPSILGPTGTTSFLSAIRVLTGTVYFTGDNLVGSIPVAGGAKITVATGNTPGALAVDNSYVYFIDATPPGGNVKRAGIGGGQLKTYYPQAGSIGIDVDATHVYWITNFTSNQGKVMRAPK